MKAVFRSSSTRTVDPSHDLVPLGHSCVFTFLCIFDSSSQNIDLEKIVESVLHSHRQAKPGQRLLVQGLSQLLFFRLYISKGLAWVSVSCFSIAEELSSHFASDMVYVEVKESSEHVVDLARARSQSRAFFEWTS